MTPPMTRRRGARALPQGAILALTLSAWPALAGAQQAPAQAPSYPDEASLVLGQPRQTLAQRRPASRRPDRRPAARPATRQPSRRPASRGPRRSSSMTVPIDIGIAPTANFVTGLVQRDQLIHTGLRFSVAAVLDNALIRQNLDRVPKQYRGMVSKSDEIRVNPYALFTPHSLIISPKIYDTGVYGIAFRPLAAGLVITPSPVRLSIDGGVMLKYLFIHSDTLPSPTHFIRPGLELRADLEVPIVSQQVYMSVGWASQLYVPQRVGGSPWEAMPLEESILHIGQAYVMLHFRVPYTTTKLR